VVFLVLMSEKLASSVGSNLNQWANALRDTSPEIARVFGENRKNGFEALDSLDLPRYKRVQIGLTDFFANPQGAFDELGSTEFYVVAQPKSDSAGRISKSGLSAENVLNFLNHHIGHENVEDYDLTLQEYFQNLYGGNIIINSNGQIYAEFKRGKQGPISKGTSTPEFFISRDQYVGLFRYSFEDTELREAMYRTIRSIPHYGSGRTTHYHPGYYEFALVERTSDAIMTPIFFDYREGKLFEI
jgi:hypothetical protein